MFFPGEGAHNSWFSITDPNIGIVKKKTCWGFLGTFSPRIKYMTHFPHDKNVPLKKMTLRTLSGQRSESCLPEKQHEAPSPRLSLLYWRSHEGMKTLNGVKIQESVVSQHQIHPSISDNGGETMQTPLLPDQSANQWDRGKGENARRLDDCRREKGIFLFHLYPMGLRFLWTSIQQH